MKNNKGFTLIELLAVIVILAIIMVIAVPQILNVINNSRDSAWENSVMMVKKSMGLNATLKSNSISTLCSEPAKIAEVADLGDIDTITCSPDTSNNTYTFTLNGKGQFENKSATLVCTGSGSCEINSQSSSQSGSQEEVVTENWNLYYYGNGSRQETTTYDSTWNVWIQVNDTKKETCGKFAAGVVCLENNADSEYEAIKKAEMEAKGATCTLSGNDLDCSDAVMHCQINGSGAPGGSFCSVISTTVTNYCTVYAEQYGGFPTCR